MASLAPFVAFLHAFLHSLQSFLIYIKILRQPSYPDVESALPNVPLSPSSVQSSPKEPSAHSPSPTPDLDAQTLLCRASSLLAAEADTSYVTQISIYSQEGSYKSTNLDDESTEASSRVLNLEDTNQLLSRESGCTRQITLSVRNPDPDVVSKDNKDASTERKKSEPAQPRPRTPLPNKGSAMGTERRLCLILGGGFTDIASRRGQRPLQICVITPGIPVKWMKPEKESSVEVEQTPHGSHTPPSTHSTPLPLYTTEDAPPALPEGQADLKQQLGASVASHRTVQHNKQGYLLSYLAQQSELSPLLLPVLKGRTASGQTAPPPYGLLAPSDGSPELSSTRALPTKAAEENAEKPKGIRPLRLPAEMAKRSERSPTPRQASPALRPLLLPQDVAYRTEHMSRAMLLTRGLDSPPKVMHRSPVNNEHLSPRLERILDLLDAAGVPALRSTTTSQSFDLSRIGMEESSSSIASTSGSQEAGCISCQDSFETGLDGDRESWKDEIINAYILSCPEALIC